MKWSVILAGSRDVVQRTTPLSWHVGSGRTGTRVTKRQLQR
ncbi:hypothetical protein NJ7G_3727 [Natrinema sp. J7-2]|nr:hypothetical protein NJ7G_3727 [Natrinema sp. J7-2]